MAAVGAGRGAQVRLDGEQRRAARGAGAATLWGNLEAKRQLEHAGAVSDGHTPDGSSPIGVPPEEEVLVPAGGPAPDPAALVPAADLEALAFRVLALEDRLAALREEMDALQARYG